MLVQLRWCEHFCHMCIIRFHDAVLNMSYLCSCNSGFLPTLEPGVPIIYMCRRVHTATSTVSLDDRSQAGLTDGSNVHYFPIIHQAHFFSNLFRVPYSEFAL
jgi:hypothetical protein